jgi:hypothetical protein
MDSSEHAVMAPVRLARVGERAWLGQAAIACRCLHPCNSIFPSPALPEGPWSSRVRGIGEQAAYVGGSFNGAIARRRGCDALPNARCREPRTRRARLPAWPTSP